MPQSTFDSGSTCLAAGGRICRERCSIQQSRHVRGRHAQQRGYAVIKTGTDITRIGLPLDF